MIAAPLLQSGALIPLWHSKRRFPVPFARLTVPWRQSFYWQLSQRNPQTALLREMVLHY